MCDPVSLAVASAGMQAYSGMQAANASADAAEQNARLARDQANAVEDKKARDLTLINQQEQQTKGTQRAAMASSGVDSGYGSGLSILSDTAYLAQQDKNNLEMNAAYDKWGFNSQAAQYDAQAGAARAAGKNNAIGTVLSTAASLSAKSTPTTPTTSPVKEDNFFKAGYYGAKDAWGANTWASKDAWQVSKVGKVNNKWYK